MAWASSVPAPEDPRALKRMVCSTTSPVFAQPLRFLSLNVPNSKHTINTLLEEHHTDVDILLFQEQHWGFIGTDPNGQEALGSVTSRLWAPVIPVESRSASPETASDDVLQTKTRLRDHPTE